MPSYDEHISILVDLGLSKAQARVYLALLESKNPTARVLSKISGISRPDVYRILSNLEDDGLIKKIISKPEKFQPISVKEIVSTLMERRKRKTEQLQKKTTRLTQTLHVQKTTEELAHARYYLTSGTKSVMRDYLKDLTETQETKDCVLDWKRLLYVTNRHFECIKEVAKRGVKIRFITNTPEGIEFPQIIQTLNEFGSCEVKFASTVPKAGIDIFDRKVVHFISSSVRFEDPEVLRLTNAEIVDLAQDYFELKWRSAKALVARENQKIKT